jgi:hypothetical protein
MPRSTRTNKNHPRCQFCGRSLERSRFGRKLIWSHPEPNACPTPERALHGEIAREQRILDDQGRAASPFRKKTNFDLLETRGIIDHNQFLAGEAFNNNFHTAGLDTLKAVDLLKPPRLGAAPADIPPRVMRCCDYVWSRISALGGLGTLPGSLCWGVVGLEISLSARCTLRALHGRLLDAHEARGILIGVLTLLAVDTSSRLWRPPPPRMHTELPDFAAIITGRASPVAPV